MFSLLLFYPPWAALNIVLAFITLLCSWMTHFVVLIYKHFLSVLITFGLGYVNFRMLFNYPLVLYFVRFRLVFGSILICIQELSSNGWSLMLFALSRECEPKTNFSYTLARRSYSQISSPVKFWSLCSGGNWAEFSLILIVLIFLICSCELKMMLFSNY